jgi:hypothetical protein
MSLGLLWTEQTLCFLFVRACNLAQHRVCNIASSAAAAAAAAAAVGLNAHAVDKLDGTHATPTEGQAYYDQQPELLESLFYLWRFTGNETYRDWGWQIFRAMRMWTRWVERLCIQDSL